MKLPCKVIEDLLPLYHDGVCSPESAALVEEHLAGCENCQAMLKDYDYQVGEAAPVEDTAPLQAIKHRWDKERRRKWLLIVVAIIPFLLAEGIVGGYIWWELHVNFSHTDTDTLTVSEVCCYANGSIGFAVDQTGEIERGNVFWIGGDGIAYLDYQQPRMGNRRDISFYQLLCFAETEVETEEMRETFYARDDGSGYNRCVIYTLKPGQTVTEVRLGNAKDYIVIWQEGQELPAASPELEEKYFGG